MQYDKIVISDTGVIISLAIIDKLYLLKKLFREIYIPQAVWNELNSVGRIMNLNKIKNLFRDKVRIVQGDNTLSSIMDYGESESVLLYKELKAGILLIDDKRGREIAESLNVNCVGTLGILTWAKTKGFIDELRPLFIFLLKNNRFYSKDLLNSLLNDYNEVNI